jgi:hypothetical protein
MVISGCQAVDGGSRMRTERKRRWIVADVIDEAPGASPTSAAMRRALLAALAAIEGIRQPLDDLGDEGGDGDAGGSRSDPLRTAAAGTDHSLTLRDVPRRR